MNENRPRITIEWSPAAWLVEALALAMLIACVALVAAAWSGLPATIPVHFDALGKPDRTGPRETLLLLPAIHLVLYVLLTVVARFPHLCNVPFRITPENAARQYQLVVGMLRFVKLMSGALLAWVVHGSIRVAKADAAGLSSIGLWGILGVLFAGIAVYFVLALRAR